MTRKDIVFAILSAFFLTNAIVAEVIGGKLIDVAPSDFKIGPLGPFVMSVGVVPWPVVFLTTDLINEYFGRRGVQRLTFLAVAMISYVFLILWLTRKIPASGLSPIDDVAFNKVLGQTQYIIAGSLAAFAVSQVVDVFVFHVFRRRTGKAMIWLRSTGSTVVSQLIDSFIVLWIGLAIPYHWGFQQYISTAFTNYSFKLLIAVALTPLIYVGHWAVGSFLGHDEAEELAERAAQQG